MSYNNNLLIRIGALKSDVEKAIETAEAVNENGSNGYDIAQLKYIRNLVAELDDRQFKRIEEE